jgi:hypothetical protein
MKALKLMLAALFVAFALASDAGIDPSPKSTKCVKLNYQNAIHKPDLCKEMRLQLKSEMIYSNTSLYTARVTCKGVTYLITGTTTQWTRFFRLGTDPTIAKGKFGIGKD